MGKSLNPKPKGRPDHIMESGEPSPGPGIVSMDEMLDVWLEKIAPQVHAQTNKGNNVFVDPASLNVSTSLGVLGVIPQGKAPIVITSGFLSGFVLTITNNPMSVRVRLS